MDGLWIALGIVVAAIVVAAAVLGSDGREWRALTKRRVLVHTDDRTFDGILWERCGPYLVLRDVTASSPNNPDGIPVDGDVVIERVRIQWMQVAP